MPTQHQFWHNDKTTDFLSHSLFGQMSAVLTEINGEELLTLCREDFRVRTSPVLEVEPESLESAVGFGKRWHELSVRFSRDTLSWKTHRCLFQEDLPQSSVTLPQWGMMLDGVCLEQLMPVRHIDETESGLSERERERESNNSTNQYRDVGNAKKVGCDGRINLEEKRNDGQFINIVCPGKELADTSEVRQGNAASYGKLEWEKRPNVSSLDRKWWAREPEQTTRTIEPGLGGVVDGMANRVDRIACLGNGQVPAVVKLAWETLTQK
jgi:hypothetical protein